MNPTSSHDPLENLLQTYLDDYIAANKAARIIAGGLKVCGTGIRPLIDHITFRTLNVEKRAEEFLSQGYTYDEKLGVIEYEHWWAKVYRKKGYPALFLDQAFDGDRGRESLIPAWVEEFGERTVHHCAILVGNIEESVFYLEKQGIRFAGKIIGKKGSDLRQVFTLPEEKNGKPFSVLELTERHRGYEGFLPPQADGLMESTRSPY